MSVGGCGANPSSHWVRLEKKVISVPQISPPAESIHGSSYPWGQQRSSLSAWGLTRHFFHALAWTQTVIRHNSQNKPVCGMSTDLSVSVNRPQQGGEGSDSGRVSAPWKNNDERAGRFLAHNGGMFETVDTRSVIEGYRQGRGPRRFCESISIRRAVKILTTVEESNTYILNTEYHRTVIQSYHSQMLMLIVMLTAQQRTQPSVSPNWQNVLK